MRWEPVAYRLDSVLVTCSVVRGSCWPGFAFRHRVPTAQVAHNGVEPADERMLLVGVADTSCPKGPYAGHASIRGPRNPVTAFAKVRFLDVAVRQLRASWQFQISSTH